MYLVYILESLCDGTHYVGSTGKSVEERLARHNRGDYRYTKGRRPWRVVCVEEVASRSKAVQRERFLKSGIGRQGFSAYLSKKRYCPVV